LPLMPLPSFDSQGDLPEGVHPATLSEVLERFGGGTTRRRQATDSLLHVLKLARLTRCLDRFIIFGSYVTAKAEPNDVDIFLVMNESFDVDDQTGEAREMFAHKLAHERLGASVFWVSRLTSFASIDYLYRGMAD